MSTPKVSRTYFFRDLILSMIGLCCGRLFASLEPPPADLTDTVAIITGGNSGIGLQIALELVRRGATVYLACRSASKAEDAVIQLVAKVPTSNGRVKSLLLDTSSLTSVRTFAKTWESLDTKIDLLFHNAGVGHTSPGQDFSTDGFPMFYATNFLGSFLLTYLLEPHLSADARIILTSSTGHYVAAFPSTFSLSSIKEKSEPGYHVPIAAIKAGKAPADLAVYGQTKAMQVAFAKLLQDHFDRKAAQTGMKNRKVAHAFSPGFALTPIFSKSPNKRFFDDPVFWALRLTNTTLAVDVSQGAATGMWLASTNDEAVVGEGMGGRYWDRMTRRVSKVDMMSKETVERLWVRWEADAEVEWR